MPKVSIVIITKNQKKFMEQTLPMIFKQTFKDFEVVVADSGSTDGALEVMKKYPVKILNVKMKPFNHARAFNLGARKAKGDYLVRLSGDAIPANKRWLENLLKGLEKKKVAGTCSCYVFSHRCDLLYQFWFGSLAIALLKNSIFAGASCALKRRFWQKYPFNEKWGLGDDWEWGEVMRRAGYKTLNNKNSLVYHEHRSPILRQLKDISWWLTVGLFGWLWRYKEILMRAQKIKYAPIHS